MKTIDVRIAWDKPDEQHWLNADNIKTALEAHCCNTNFAVTELPPPRGEIENKCEWRWDTDGFWHTNCGDSFTLNTGELKQNEFNYCHKCGRKIYEMYPVEPAAPVAPAVETEMGMTPSTKAFLKKAGVKVKTVDDVFLKNILANSGNNPHPPCPSCEKLRAENAELNTQRNNAEIQLVAIIQAVSGFTKTKPKMTIGEFEKYLPKICKFAREAEKEEFERKIGLNQTKGE